jgi:hypothetical protein
LEALADSLPKEKDEDDNRWSLFFTVLSQSTMEAWADAIHEREAVEGDDRVTPNDAAKFLPPEMRRQINETYAVIRALPLETAREFAHAVEKARSDAWCTDHDEFLNPIAHQVGWYPGKPLDDLALSDSTRKLIEDGVNRLSTNPPKVSR